MPVENDAAFLGTLKAEREITRVILRYARGSDRKDLELMRSAYHPDAVDRHGPSNGSVDQFLEWARGHHEKYEVMIHMQGSPQIELHGDVALVETYCLIFQKLKPELTYAGSIDIGVFIACRYVDRFECRNGEWKIAERNVVYDWVKKDWAFQQAGPGAIWDARFLVGKRSNDDMVYEIKRQLRP